MIKVGSKWKRVKKGNLTPSSFNAIEGEIVTITNISAGTVYFTPLGGWSRYGEEYFKEVMEPYIPNNLIGGKLLCLYLLV